jgi:hypothetical protein
VKLWIEQQPIYERRTLRQDQPIGGNSVDATFGMIRRRGDNIDVG